MSVGSAPTTTFTELSRGRGGRQPGTTVASLFRRPQGAPSTRSWRLRAGVGTQPLMQPLEVAQDPDVGDATIADGE